MPVTVASFTSSRRGFTTLVGGRQRRQQALFFQPGIERYVGFERRQAGLQLFGSERAALGLAGADRQFGGFVLCGLQRLALLGGGLAKFGACVVALAFGAGGALLGCVQRVLQSIEFFLGGVQLPFADFLFSRILVARRHFSRPPHSL